MGDEFQVTPDEEMSSGISALDQTFSVLHKLKEI